MTRLLLAAAALGLVGIVFRHDLGWCPTCRALREIRRAAGMMGR